MHLKIWLSLELIYSDCIFLNAFTLCKSLPWHDFLKRYDRQKTFFYLDPPYYLAPYYEHNLELEDYKQMAEILAGIKSKFILSINDHPHIRDTFKTFNIKPVTLKYTVAKDKTTVGKELLVINFKTINP